MSSIVGTRIRECRRDCGLTLEELSKKVGVTAATINKYETNVVSNLKKDVIEKLAKALLTTPAYLMGWDNTTYYANAHTNNGVIAQNTNTVNFNGHESLSKEEAELLRIYKNLDVKKRIELVSTALRLETENSNQ